MILRDRDAFVLPPAPAPNGPWAGWESKDIGQAPRPGRVWSGLGGLRVESNGLDIGGTADSFHFVSRKVSGDFELLTLVRSLQMASPDSTVGLMIRADDTEAGAVNVFAGVLADRTKGGAIVQRSAAGAAAVTAVQDVGTRDGQWLRLVREGRRFTAYRSTQLRVNWTRIGSVEVDLPVEVRAGLAVASRHPQRATVTEIAALRLHNLDSQPATRGWTLEEMGPPAGASAIYEADGLKVAGLTDPVSLLQETGLFAFQEAAGEQMLTVKVGPFSHPNPSARVGLMLREGPAVQFIFTRSTPAAIISVTAGMGVQFMSRPIPTIMGTVAPPVDGVKTPIWLRLTRADVPGQPALSWVTGAYSTDGTTFVPVGAAMIPLPEPYLIGPYVSSSGPQAPVVATLTDSAHPAAARVGSSRRRGQSGGRGRPRRRPVMSGGERRPDLVLAALSLALAGAVGCDNSPSPISERHQRPVVISEIMYHPVREDSDAEEHEFIELHNRSDCAVALAGWKLTGAVTYTFPADTTLGPYGYLVVARNKERLAADVPSYRLEASALHGPYTGGLDNGGERLLLVDAGGDPMDEALYDDERPWPLGADALGAGEDWLSPALLPLERHRFMGRSLERISFDHAGTSAANWAASALDGATPGRRNGYRGPPLPVIEAIAVTPDCADGPPRIGAEDGARIRVSLGRVPGVDGSLADPQVEYFVDDIERVGEPTEKVALTPVGDGWEAQIPRQPAGSVVRYRVVGNRGAGRELLSPLASDPHPYHGYFVEPEIPGQTPVYQLFISKADWTDLWLSSQAGRVPDNGTGTNPAQCQVNPRWAERVPAILVVGGRVHDVRVRYQGSFQNRLGGSTWIR